MMHSIRIRLIMVVVTTLLFSSCASILTGRYQKIAILADSNDEILIDGEVPQMKKGLYKVRKDHKPKQITVKREGYRDEHTVIVPYRVSPLKYVSILFLYYPYLFDTGDNIWLYDKEIQVGKDMISLSRKGEDAKEIRLNKLGIDMKAENVKYSRFVSYRHYKKKNEKVQPISTDSKKEIRVENTIFEPLLNELLMENGYIDTTHKVLKNSYLNNLYIDATITDFTFHDIAVYYYYHGGLVYVDLTIEWKALDYYRKPVFSCTTKAKSGEFAVKYKGDDEASVDNAIKDAMQVSLIEFMNKDEVIKLMNDKTSDMEFEASFTEIEIPLPKKPVSNVAEAIKASVTIRNANGHGSGVIISEDGYIITNYHVVSDDKNLKVITNDEKEYDVKVVRASKIYDLALLKIEGDMPFAFTVSNSEDIEIATEIYAVGTPTAEDLSQTVSRGIISGVRKNDGMGKLIQTDASINGGNSGGAIINSGGLVLAIVSSKLKGFGIEGVAFGIPAHDISKSLKIRFKPSE